MARRVRDDHGVPARLAARRQGREQPGRERSHRGTRPAPVARLLRERLPVAARVLRRARPRHNGSHRSSAHLARGDDPHPRGRPRGSRPGNLGPLDGPLQHERRVARRTRRAGGTSRRDDHSGLRAARAAARGRLPRVAHHRSRRALGARGAQPVAERPARPESHRHRPADRGARRRARSVAASARCVRPGRARRRGRVTRRRAHRGAGGAARARGRGPRRAPHMASRVGDDCERAWCAGRRPVDRSAGIPSRQRRGLPRLDHSPRRRARGGGVRVHPRPLRPRVRGSRRGARATRCECRSRGVHDLEDVLRVQGRDLLEDDRGNG